MKSEEPREVPVACDLTTLDSNQNRRREALLGELLSNIQSSLELSNGYEFVLPSDDGWYLKIAEWILLERLCCPFLSFEQGFRQTQMWFRLTGDKNVKQFLKTSLSPVMRKRQAAL